MAPPVHLGSDPARPSLDSSVSGRSRPDQPGRFCTEGLNEGVTWRSPTGQNMMDGRWIKTGFCCLLRRAAGVLDFPAQETKHACAVKDFDLAYSFRVRFAHLSPCSSTKVCATPQTHRTQAASVAV